MYLVLLFNRLQQVREVINSVELNYSIKTCVNCSIERKNQIQSALF